MNEGFVYGLSRLPWALEKIAGLDERQFQVLRDAVTGPAGFDRKLVRCEVLADQLKADLKPSDVFHLLLPLRFLYDRCRDWEKDGRETGAALREFLELTGLDEHLGKEPGPALKRLLELTAKNPEIERRRKLRWLRTGILETAVEFASFVDIRPRISDDRSAIQGLVPVVIFRIATESESGGEESYVFQLPQEGVSKLRAVLEDIEKKLKLVESDPLFGGRFEREISKHEDEEEEEP